jgi:hypothetical protein
MFYRLTQALHRGYFRFHTGRVRATPPLPCDPAAACELHTMLSARDVDLYLPAVKSFLRFHAQVAVVVHSDGSLDETTVALLRQHVPGVRIVLPAEADERARQALGADSFLFRWRGHDASWRRVIDTELWCQTPKRIIMDADVIVLRRPDEIIAWIEDGPGAFLFGQPPDPAVNGHAAPAGRKLVQTIFREKTPQLARRLELPAAFPQGATSGFYGCGWELALDRIEQAIRAGEAEGIPMAEWGSEQCVVIYLLAAAGARRLNPRHYLNYDPGCTPLLAEAHAVHFYGTYRYYRHLYTRLAGEVVSGLSAAS